MALESTSNAGIIIGLPPINAALAELVLPGSIPINLPIYYHLNLILILFCFCMRNCLNVRGQLPWIKLSLYDLENTMRFQKILTQHIDETLEEPDKHE
ncbi:MAG TPA: hypothetical protein VFT71_08430 [Candidatus Nitrosocosmicus sp.]|nr:hypothetical protein [Candidatus Nitrosocosmicus sp.]